MSRYFTVIRTNGGYSVLADLATDSIKLYSTVLAAEEDAAYNADALVFDISKTEQAVPLPEVNAGGDILVNGTWVRPATLGSYV